MAGSPTFEHGVHKAVTSPFRVGLFWGIALLVIVLGRAFIDFISLPSQHADALIVFQQTALVNDLGIAQYAPSFFGSTAERAKSWSSHINTWLFQSSGLDRLLDADPDSLNVTERAIQRGLNTQRNLFHALISGMQIIAVRCAILLSAIPTGIFFYCMTFVDGAVARLLRRYGGGRESATIYHRAKYYQAVLITIGCVGYFWWPTAIDPRTTLPILLGCISFLFGIQVKYYKKYL